MGQANSANTNQCTHKHVKMTLRDNTQDRERVSMSWIASKEMKVDSSWRFTSTPIAESYQIKIVPPNNGVQQSYTSYIFCGVITLFKKRLFLIFPGEAIHAAV